MKRKTLLTLVLLAFVLLAACGRSIVGTWEFHRTSELSRTRTIIQLNGQVQLFTFESGGTGINGFGFESRGLTYVPFTWSEEDDVLTMFMNDTEMIFTFRIDGRDLFLYEEDGSYMVYRRR